MEKIKLFLQSEKGKDLLVIIIVILVGLASFELGRLSNANTGTGVKIEYPKGSNTLSGTALNALNSSKISNTTSSPESGPRAFFASNRGKKYYSSGCTAGNSIKAENRVYFATRAQAEQAGYTMSSSCR